MLSWLFFFLLLSVLPLSAQPASTLEQPFRTTYAIKSNLLFDAIGAFNVEGEVAFSQNRYSVMGECWFPWYVWHHNSRAFELLYGGAEVRRWLGNRQKKAPLAGHFVGLYAGGGKYDLEWNSKGYQGEFLIAAGASYGYVFNLSHRFRLETSLGIGYMRTKYRYYKGMENDKYLVWQNNGRYSWFGPTKVKVSLVWILPNWKKKGGEL